MNIVTDFEQIQEQMHSVDPVKYGKTRNYIDGAVTYLSPYISRGVISTKQVLLSVFKKGYKPYQVEKFIQELAWRDYFQRVWQAKGDAVWQALKQEQPDVQHHHMPHAVETGTTGIEAVDALINRLFETGYMHNHMRMYTASITCNIGKAHWKLPAQWMYYHLLDGDIASNNCSWQWVAGAFSSKKYYCNQENINKYTHSNQRNTFLDRSYEDLPGMPVPETLLQTSVPVLHTLLPETTLPVLDPALPVLLYNSYNLDPLWRIGQDANRILVLEPSHFQNNPVRKKVIDFIIALSANIKGIQLYCGEVNDLVEFVSSASQNKNPVFISKEHPAFMHYPGSKDERDWMFPQVTGYYNSFFAYWKKCERYLKNYNEPNLFSAV